MSDMQFKYSVSFIVPVLNGERFIADCIDHIIAEMGDNDELIVVDNGSTDSTLDIVRRYGRATILQFPKSTIACIRNKGAEVAGGDVYAFIDSDCLLCKGWRKDVESALADDNVHVTGSTVDIPSPSHWIERAWYSRRGKAMTPVKYINSGNLVIRKYAFEAVEGFDEDLVTDEDYDIGERLSRNGFMIVEAPQIRVIHLDNPRSLGSFFKKERWHAISSLRALERGNIDKPTVMTIVFVLCCLIAILSLPSFIAGRVDLLSLTILLFFVPVVTAVYRSVQNDAYGFIPALVVLYFLFYIARGLALLQYGYTKVFGRPASVEGR